MPRLHLLLTWCIIGTLLNACDYVSTINFELTNAVNDTCIIDIGNGYEILRVTPGSTVRIQSYERVNSYASDIHADKLEIDGLPTIKISRHDTLLCKRDYHKRSNWVYMENSRYRATYRSLIRPKDF